MATILLANVDLFLRAKLEGALAPHRLVTTAADPDLVLCDIGRADVGEVGRRWKDVPILGFTNHTDTDGLKRALAAGFSRVVVKSALAARGPAIVDELLAGERDG
ncbi:MAG: hypothetical protein U0R50_01155 [Gaiellales bacterium]